MDNTQTQIKTRRTAPKVVYKNEVMRDWQTNDEANKLCIEFVGQIIMGMTGGNTGFHKNGNIRLYYDKKANTVTASVINK